MILGITGGIGSGKSLALQWFAHHGIITLNADTIARELVEPGTPVHKAIRQKFGPAILHCDGTIDRSALRQHIMDSDQGRKDLERIMHPQIANVRRRRFRHARDSNQNLVYEAALLFEAGVHRQTDSSLAILCPTDIRMQRVVHRDQRAPDEIRRTMDIQLTDAERCLRADYILSNTSDTAAFYRRLAQLCQRIGISTHDPPA